VTGARSTEHETKDLAEIRKSSKEKRLELRPWGPSASSIYTWPRCATPASLSLYFAPRQLFL